MSSPLFTITFPNLDEIGAAFKKAPQLMRPALRDAINRSLLTIGKEAVINLTHGVYEAPISKSGYKRTGNLRASILNPNQGLTLATDSVFTGSVGSGVGYGLFIEAGTRYMDSRPYLLPAAADSEEQVNQFFTGAVQGVLNKIASAS